MGPPQDGVVDARLRVHGVQRLRVADASVMPTIASSNTNAPAIMIGEKAADMILADAPLQERMARETQTDTADRGLHRGGRVESPVGPDPLARSGIHGGLPELPRGAAAQRPAAEALQGTDPGGDQRRHDAPVRARRPAPHRQRAACRRHPRGGARDHRADHGHGHPFVQPCDPDPVRGVRPASNASVRRSAPAGAPARAKVSM
jgi:hypothetical protein